MILCELRETLKGLVRGESVEYSVMKAEACDRLLDHQKDPYYAYLHSFECRAFFNQH